MSITVQLLFHTPITDDDYDDDDDSNKFDTCKGF